METLLLKEYTVVVRTGKQDCCLDFYWWLVSRLLTVVDFCSIYSSDLENR